MAVQQTHVSHPIGDKDDLLNKLEDAILKHLILLVKLKMKKRNGPE